MGYLTTLEISHDYADRLQDRSNDLAAALLELCRAGSARRPEVDQVLASFGVIVGPTRHSSEPSLFVRGKRPPEEPSE